MYFIDFHCHVYPDTIAFKAADSIFVPAGAGKVQITGKCTVVKTTV